MLIVQIKRYMDALYQKKRGGGGKKKTTNKEPVNKKREGEAGGQWPVILSS